MANDDQFQVPICKTDILYTYRDPTDHDIPSTIKKWVNMTNGKHFVLNQYINNEIWEEYNE